MANELIYKSDALRAILKADPYVSFCIDNIKPVDAVEVVRCKDCKYYQKNQYDPEGEMRCKCWCDWLPTDPDDFCSYGEKLPKITEQTMDAIMKMGENAHKQIGDLK